MVRRGMKNTFLAVLLSLGVAYGDVAYGDEAYGDEGYGDEGPKARMYNPFESLIPTDSGTMGIAGPFSNMAQMGMNAGSQFASMAAASPLNPMNAMQNIARLNPLMGEGNPMANLNPMNAMDAMAGLNPMNAMAGLNPMDTFSGLNPLNAMDSFSPMNPFGGLSPFGSMGNISSLGGGMGALSDLNPLSALNPFARSDNDNYDNSNYDNANFDNANYDNDPNVHYTQTFSYDPSPVTTTQIPDTDEARAALTAIGRISGVPDLGEQMDSESWLSQQGPRDEAPLYPSGFDMAKIKAKIADAGKEKLDFGGKDYPPLFKKPGDKLPGDGPPGQGPPGNWKPGHGPPGQGPPGNWKPGHGPPGQGPPGNWKPGHGPPGQGPPGHGPPSNWKPGHGGPGDGIDDLPDCKDAIGDMGGFDPYTTFLSFLDMATPFSALFGGPSFRSTNLAAADIMAQVQQTDTFLTLFPDMAPMVRSFGCQVDMSPLGPGAGGLSLPSIIPFCDSQNCKLSLDKAKAIIMNPIKLGMLPLKFMVLMAMVPLAAGKMKAALIKQKFKGLTKGFLMLKIAKKAKKKAMALMALQAGLGFKMLVKGIKGFTMLFKIQHAVEKMCQLMTLGKAVKAQLYRLFVMGIMSIIRKKKQMKCIWMNKIKKSCSQQNEHGTDMFFSSFRSAVASQDSKDGHDEEDDPVDLTDGKHIFAALIDNHIPDIYEYENQVQDLLAEYEGFRSIAAVDAPEILEESLSSIFDNNPLINNKMGTILSLDLNAIEKEALSSVDEAEGKIRGVTGQDSVRRTPPGSIPADMKLGFVTPVVLDTHLAKMGTMIDLDQDIIREIKSFVTTPGPIADQTLMNTVAHLAQGMGQPLADNVPDANIITRTQDTLKTFLLQLPDVL